MNRVRPVTLDEKKEIADFLAEKYQCGKMTQLLEGNLYFLHNKVYFIQQGFSQSLLSKILSGTFPIVSLGLPILLKRRTFLPLLPVGSYLVDRCRNVLELPERLAQKLLYGKRITVRESYPFEEALLVDNLREFLAFLRLKSTSSGTEIIPALDIGWYLREGG